MFESAGTRLIALRLVNLDLTSSAGALIARVAAIRCAAK